MYLLPLLPLLLSTTTALPSPHPPPRDLDFSVDAGSGPPYATRPSFTLTVTEFCDDLKMEAGAEFSTSDGRFTDTLDFNYVAAVNAGVKEFEGMKVEKVSGGRLGIGYDYGRHDEFS